jgi:predicted enzyme related to lactoylglutathione lyase
MIKLGAVIWTTSRVEEMLEFYKMLGIPLAVDTHGEDGHAPHFEADVDGVHYAVFPAKDDAPSPELGSGPGSYPGTTMIGLGVDNIVELSEQLRERGVQFRTPLQETPWGRRIVVFDPDGRAVELYQPLP